MSAPALARRQHDDKRVPRDAYRTDPRDAEACVRRLVDLGWLDVDQHVVAEPHCGGGAWLFALDAVRLPAPQWRVGDADPAADGLHFARLRGAPAVVSTCRRFPWGADWTIGNPPYRGLGDTVERLLRRSVVGVALLLEAAWLFRSAPRMQRLPAPVGVFRFREGRRRFEVPQTGPWLGQRWLRHPRAPAVEHSLVVWMHQRPAGLAEGAWVGGWV